MLLLLMFVWERTCCWAANFGELRVSSGLWRAVAPLMAPWCTDWKVPTCPNLNFYGSSGSRVRWHSENEGRFGKQWDSKLMVLMSFGASALFQMETWAWSGQ